MSSESNFNSSHLNQYAKCLIELDTHRQSNDLYAYRLSDDGQSLITKGFLSRFFAWVFHALGCSDDNQMFMAAAAKIISKMGQELGKEHKKAQSNASLVLTLTSDQAEKVSTIVDDIFKNNDAPPAVTSNITLNPSLQKYFKGQQLLSEINVKLKLSKATDPLSIILNIPLPEEIKNAKAHFNERLRDPALSLIQQIRECRTQVDELLDLANTTPGITEHLSIELLKRMQKIDDQFGGFIEELADKYRQLNSLEAKICTFRGFKTIDKLTEAAKNLVLPKESDSIDYFNSLTASQHSLIKKIKECEPEINHLLELHQKGIEDSQLPKDVLERMKEISDQFTLRFTDDKRPANQMTKVYMEHAQALHDSRIGNLEGKAKMLAILALKSEFTTLFKIENIHPSTGLSEESEAIGLLFSIIAEGKVALEKTPEAFSLTCFDAAALGDQLRIDPPKGFIHWFLTTGHTEKDPEKEREEILKTYKGDLDRSEFEIVDENGGTQYFPLSSGASYEAALEARMRKIISNDDPKLDPTNIDLKITEWKNRLALLCNQALKAVVISGSGLSEDEQNRFIFQRAHSAGLHARIGNLIIKLSADLKTVTVYGDVFLRKDPLNPCLAKVAVKFEWDSVTDIATCETFSSPQFSPYCTAEDVEKIFNAF